MWSVKGGFSTAAERERSNTAGPLTPNSVNCTSPRLSATVSRPRQRVSSPVARTPLRALT